jgi:hypothetical protein
VAFINCIEEIWMILINELKYHLHMPY